MKKYKFGLAHAPELSQMQMLAMRHAFDSISMLPLESSEVSAPVTKRELKALNVCWLNSSLELCAEAFEREATPVEVQITTIDGYRALFIEGDDSKMIIVDLGNVRGGVKALTLALPVWKPA